MNLTALAHRVRPRHAIVAAIAAVLAAGLLYSRPADAGNLDWEMTSGLLSIKTDQSGTIESVRYRNMNKEKTVNGCGAKIANLPHLVEALQLSKAVDIAVQDNCLKGVQVYKP
jgi:hypothetical protein